MSRPKEVRDDNHIESEDTPRPAEVPLDGHPADGADVRLRPLFRRGRVRKRSASRWKVDDAAEAFGLAGQPPWSGKQRLGEPEPLNQISVVADETPVGTHVAPSAWPAEKRAEKPVPARTVGAPSLVPPPEMVPELVVGAVLHYHGDLALLGDTAQNGRCLRNHLLRP
jgi:hypothetical protein